MTEVPIFYRPQTIRGVINMNGMNEVLLQLDPTNGDRADTTIPVPVDCLYNNEDKIYVGYETTMILTPRNPRVRGGIAIKHRTPEDPLSEVIPTRLIIPHDADIIGAVSIEQYVDEDGQIRTRTHDIHGSANRVKKEAKHVKNQQGEHQVSANVRLYISKAATKIAGDLCADCPAQKLCGRFQAAKLDIDNLK